MAQSVGVDGVTTLIAGWTDQSTSPYSTGLESGGSASFSAGFDSATQNGYSAWSVPAWAASSTASLGGTTNTNYLIKVYVPAAFSSAHMDVDCTTAGTVTHAYAGLYSIAGTKLILSADIQSTWTTGKMTYAWTAAQPLTGNTYYYVALLFTDSAAPALAATPASAVTNYNLASGTENYASNGTAATLPASYTLTSNTPLATAIPWVALY